MKIPWIRKELHEDIPPLGTPHMLAQWVREADDDGGNSGPLIDMLQYGKLRAVLPDHIWENLEKARLARDGRMPMLKAGLGYVELLSSVIVDGTAVHDSSTEAFLFPALLFPANYLQPGGIPGRTIRFKGSGRITTLSTAATLIFNWGAATTNAIPTTTWAKTGAVTMDAAVHTNEQWFAEGTTVVRSVGSSGTVFAQGWSNNAAQAFTLANESLQFMGSAGNATPATATVDQTVPEYVSLTAKWSLTTAYSITGHVFTVEALN